MTANDDRGTTQQVLHSLGARLAAYRLGRNITQAELAAQAGVSVPTIARLEQGRSATLTNLIRVLRALDLAHNLDALVPEAKTSPMDALRANKQTRQRASSAKPVPAKVPWSWGDK